MGFPPVHVEQWLSRIRNSKSECARVVHTKKGAWLRRYGTITYLGLVLARQIMQDGCKVVDRGETPVEFISKGGRLSLLEKWGFLS